jgi:LacI family transcriptional regulator
LLSDRIASDAYAGDVIRGALTTTLLHQHLLFIGETGGDPQVTTQLIHGMIDRGVGGFLLASMYTQRIRIPTELRTHPMVLVNCVGRAAGVPMVVPDEFEAGRSAVRVLLRHGHRDKIVLVGETPSRVIAAAERRAGIDQTLTASGLTLAGSLPSIWWPEPTYQAVSAYLATGKRPSAFICLNDRVAMGVYQATRDRGLSIPDDVSVVSFDDSELAGWLQPGLTSIAIPHLELGRRGVELLLDPNRTGGMHRVPMPLRERGSIGTPP